MHAYFTLYRTCSNGQMSEFTLTVLHLLVLTQPVNQENVVQNVHQALKVIHVDVDSFNNIIHIIIIGNDNKNIIMIQ